MRKRWLAPSSPSRAVQMPTRSLGIRRRLTAAACRSLRERDVGPAVLATPLLRGGPALRSGVGFPQVRKDDEGGLRRKDARYRSRRRYKRASGGSARRELRHWCASVPEGRDPRARAAGTRLRSPPIYERLPLCSSSLTTSPEAGHPPGVELSGVNIDRSLGQRPFTVT